MNVNYLESRHIGLTSKDEKHMLDYIGSESMEALVRETMPEDIILPEPIELEQARTEQVQMEVTETTLLQNEPFRSYIGRGWYGTNTPAVIRRNAYGRQLGSFFIENEVDHIGKVPQTFIRAPFFESVGNDVEVLSRTVSNNAGVDAAASTAAQIVAVRYKKQIALSFHPELNSDLRIHKYFLNMVGNL